MARAAAAVAGGVALAALLAGAGWASAEPSEVRRTELMHRLLQDCGSCHGMTLKGGLGPALLPETLDGKTDESLIETILNGRQGTPMPPWAFEITADEAAWMVQVMKKGIADGSRP